MRKTTIFLLIAATVVFANGKFPTWAVGKWMTTVVPKDSPYDITVVSVVELMKKGIYVQTNYMTMIDFDMINVPVDRHEGKVKPGKDVLLLKAVTCTKVEDGSEIPCDTTNEDILFFFEKITIKGKILTIIFEGEELTLEKYDESKMPSKKSEERKEDPDDYLAVSLEDEKTGILFKFHKEYQKECNENVCCYTRLFKGGLSGLSVMFWKHGPAVTDLTSAKNWVKDTKFGEKKFIEEAEIDNGIMLVEEFEALLQVVYFFPKHKGSYGQVELSGPQNMLEIMKKICLAMGKE